MPAVFSNAITIEGNVCFLSDVHFRTPADGDSRKREDKLVSFLKNEGESFQHLFLLGDIFDFWFEYDDVVPKGYFRFFNTLYELFQKGVKIYYFTGNHDMWVRNYFSEYFGCQVFTSQTAFVINGKRCMVGHGDGIGGKQRKYLLIKSIFAFSPNRVLYSMLHPKQSFAIARYCSQKSRRSHPENERIFRSEDEHQIQYAREVLLTEPIDYFIFAHRHIPIRYELTGQSVLFNSGDWLTHFSYIVFSKGEKEPQILYFTEPDSAKEKGVN